MTPIARVVSLILSLLLMPIAVYSNDLLDVSPAIIICAMGLIGLGLSKLRFLEFIPLVLSILAWILLYIIYSLRENDFELYTLLSFIYLIAPFFSYYLGKFLQREISGFFRKLLKYYSAMYSIFTIYILSVIILSHRAVRVSDFNMVSGSLVAGDKIGFPDVPFKLYGSWGIHSFIDFLVIGVTIVLFYITSPYRKTRTEWMILCVGVTASLYMIMFSFSREAWLAIIAIVILKLLERFKQHPFRVAFMALTFTLGSMWFFNSISNTYIIKRQQQFVSSGDFNSVSSGRIGIVGVGLSIIADNPLRGSIGLQNASLEGNSSLHNQFLTYFFKLGLIAGLLASVQLICNFYIPYKKNQHAADRSYEIIVNLFVVSVIMMQFWDIFLVNLIGTTIFLFLGAQSHGASRKKMGLKSTNMLAVREKMYE